MYFSIIFLCKYKVFQRVVKLVEPMCVCVCKCMVSKNWTGTKKKGISCTLNMEIGLKNDPAIHPTTRYLLQTSCCCSLRCFKQKKRFSKVSKLSKAFLRVNYFGHFIPLRAAVWAVSWKWPNKIKKVCKNCSN